LIVTTSENGEILSQRAHFFFVCFFVFVHFFW